ncbi:hypothetical protein GCM10027445_33690 [Amycolatopsis endophytica]|uniref:Uncharacterized protein n=1 Tax=Amycolatopsis endophytica TaxID=860233 RepID=A0A853B0K9_9PSEU|nr:hypothetical protein [Amycolatopsis endophytica]NYI88432.1 hypothetical protein [Amycolatopsis endophytica]
MDDQTAPEFVAEDLFTRFESWADDNGAEADPFFVEVAIDWRFHQDGDPAKWDAADLRGLLLHWFPRNVTVERDYWPDVVSTLHHWVDFLTTTPVSRTRDAETLHREIDRNAEAFHAAMADERNFGLAKFWATRMAEHDIDPEDAAKVAEFLDAVNAGEIDFDRDILDEIMRRNTAETDDADPLPPVVLPDDAELEKLAGETDLVSRMRALTGWVGAGRAVTRARQPVEAHELAELLALAPADVELLVDWATALRLVRVVKGRLVTVKARAGLLDRPWELWRRAFEVVRTLRPAVWLPVEDLWLALYRAGGSPLPVELLVQFLEESFGGGFPGESFDDDAPTSRQDLDGVVAALEWLGAVRVTTAAGAGDLDRIVQVSERGDPDPRLVLLTPLGLWGVREALMAQGMDAPLAKDLAGLPPEDVCSSLVYAHPDVTDAVLQEWAGARTPADAAAGLADFVAQTPSPTLRALAWTGLEKPGDAGEREARRLRADGGVVGAVAAGWLVRRGALDPRDPSEDERMLAASENLAALHERGLLLDGLTDHPPEDQIGLVRAVVGSEHPDRAAMLAEIAAHHPHPDIAAEARRSL